MEVLVADIRQAGEWLVVVPQRLLTGHLETVAMRGENNAWKR